MEEEISLKEIIAVLWQGRYLIIGITAAAMIIAFVISFFFTTPLYKSTAPLDFNPYLADERSSSFQLDIEQLIDGFERNKQIEKSLQDVTDHPQRLAESVFFERNGDYVEATVEARDPELAAEAAEQVRLGLIKQTEEVFQAEKEYLQYWLEHFDSRFPEAYEEYLNPAGVSTLTEDPSYVYVMEKKGQHLAELHEMKFRLHKVETIEAEQDEDYMQPAPVPREPFNIRWPLNTAVAGVLGLMLSVFIVFIRPHITELVSEIKKADQVKDQQ